MKPSNILAVFLTILAGTLVFATDAPKPANNDATTAFERLKGLAGEWEGKSSRTGKVRLTYEVVANGSAVLERYHDQDEDMVTMYHLDGDRLVLTHYCAAGNQPRMVAKRFNASGSDLIFDFLDVTNLPKPEAGHIHNMKFHFADSTHFTNEADFVENGKPKFHEVTDFVRVH